MRRFTGIFLLVVALFLSGCQVIQRLPIPFKDRLIGNGTDTTEPRDVKLIYWGLWESEEVMRPVIEQYQNLYAQKNPGSTITVEYLRKPPSRYRETLQSSIRSGQGPDIFRFHNTWVPMLREELAPLPQTIIPNSEYESAFYPITKTDLLVGNFYVGIPLMFDGLVLFYNESLFREAGINTPPTSWDELRTLAKKLTVVDTNSGAIRVAGVALGVAANVDHFSDIIGLMMLQNQADLRDLSDELAQDALRFYTILTVEDRVWDETMPPSIEAFAMGKVAMILGPHWRVFNLKEANPDLRFRTAPVPQLPGSTVNWGSYWVEGVSSRSSYQAEAWDFLKFLSQKETLRSILKQPSCPTAFLVNLIPGETWPTVF
jgi:multiple sugar transport system substrate-binding protein